jgi:hypothetical protein
MKLRRTIYATFLASESGPEIVHTGFDSDGLRDCQAYAQRLTETKQGVAEVGVITFQPLTKLEQIEIGKSHELKSNNATLHAPAKKNIGKPKLV